MGAPEDGQMGFQQAATPIMEMLTGFHLWLLVIITAIVLVVLGLMLWAVIFYNAKVRKEPAKFSHNTLVEVIWTAVPVLILVVIAVPSFKLLYYQDVVPEADLTVKATGYQWYWEYSYPDQDISVTSLMLPEEEAERLDRPYLLATWDGTDYANAGALVEAVDEEVLVCVHEEVGDGLGRLLRMRGGQGSAASEREGEPCCGSNHHRYRQRRPGRGSRNGGKGRMQRCAFGADRGACSARSDRLARRRCSHARQQALCPPVSRGRERGWSVRARLQA